MGTTTPRQFVNVFRQIRELLPAEVALELARRAQYWAPEICWQKLSAFVNNHVKPSASDETSVKIYSLLCAKSETEMRQLFIADGQL